MTALIAIDWGTSSFRAWALAADGTVLAETREGQGILAVPDGDFDCAFQAALGPWLRPGLPVIAAGMITSRNGWVETPYLPLPLDAGRLAGALVRHRTRAGHEIHFVTGAALDGDFPDVMRGEETEVIGQIAATGQDGLFVLPGTHSKWVRVEGGRITGFQTCMTGEAFAILRQHSILGRLMAPGGAGLDLPAFQRGVVAAKAPGALLARVFSARSLALFDRLQPGEIADYLSGLLIGDEIRAGLQAAAGLPVTIIGRGDLAGRYAHAFDGFGIAASVAPEGMNRRGLYDIAKRGGLIG